MIRFIPLLLAFFSVYSHATIPASGFFDANKSCQAYQSKNKKTNPGKVYIHPSMRYEVHAINRMPPDWIRVELAGREPALRWVNADCGSYDYTVQTNKACDKRPGLADSYVFAVSWQPAFCETYGYEAGKPECFKLTGESYQARHLVLHGLWPNQGACGIHYGYCGTEKQSRHCAYPEVPLSVPVAARLRKFMPGFKHGSCFERHEWNRHGLCQLLSSDDYFSLAVGFAEQLNNTSFDAYLSAHIGALVSLAQLNEEIDKALGQGASHKVFFGCKNNRLVDIHINLPADISQDESLISLVQKASNHPRQDACPRLVKISDFVSLG